MNQILSTVPQPKKGGKMKKNKASIKVSSDSKKVTRVFAIILLLFGIFIIGSGSYALYKGESTKNEQIATLNKPVISVESVDETGSTILLKVTSEIGIDKVVYQWNDANTTTLSANGSKYFEQKIQVPNGTNNLNINVTDIQGQEGTYSKKYEVNSNIMLEATDEGKIRITYEGTAEISYLTYRWDDQEEQRIDINDTIIDTQIDTLSGKHTLTVIAVDVNNNTETKVQQINGVSIPVIDISFNSDYTSYVIKVTDEVELSEVIVTLDEDESKKYGQKLSGKEFQFEIPLKEGDNKMKVEVYNSDDQKAQRMVKFTK